ncbi:MAG: DedA family protein [Capsulimonadales bacterium]|nr:DedA family protein [Capsulimonadales bacterium]
MDLQQIKDFFTHFDIWLQGTVAHYGPATYGILFAIVFAETGLVVTPFLPGDSLLFAVGAFAARPQAELNVAYLYPLFFIAALTGDNLNYWLGRVAGRRLFREDSRLLRKDYLIRTEEFFARYGGKAIILARFVPIVRTFAPFVAGMGRMPYPQFLAYSVGGAILWVGSCVTAGFFLGQLPFVKKNFEVFVLLIILFSLMPVVFEIIQHRRNTKQPNSVQQ